MSCSREFKKEHWRKLPLRKITKTNKRQTVSYNITLRRFHATMVAVEEQ